MSDVKLCIDCKYHRQAPSMGQMYHECVAFARLNPVTGENDVDTVPCGVARSDGGHCQYSGIHWKAR